MKTIRETTNRAGKRVVTVELGEGETLLSVKQADFYKLGYLVEDVMAGYIIKDMERVYWDSLEQKWIS